MMMSLPRSRQPAHESWTHNQLLHECAIALGHAIDHSTAQTYNSHLQSYLTFCKIHHFEIESTADMLSFYVIFMCHHIDPRSVSTYLSGICNTLEPHFPAVCATCNGTLVTKTLTGLKKLHASHSPTCKQPLDHADLISLFDHYNSGSYDDNLFLALVMTGFSSLMHVGEFTQLDSISRCSPTKLTLHHTCHLMPSNYSFMLPYHKGNRFFDSNMILVEQQPSTHTCPHTAFTKYIFACDTHFPLHPEL